MTQNIAPNLNAMDCEDGDVQPKFHGNTRGKGLYMDEAIGKIKMGIFNYLLIFMSGIVLFTTIVEIVGVMYVFPVSQCDLNLSPSDKGILGGAVPLGIICSSFLWGYLADTKGRRAVILPSLFIAFFLSVCASFVQNFYIFIVLRFFNGFFISGSSATIYAYLGEFHSNDQRARAIMGAAAIFSSSAVLAPLIAWSVINQDWQFQVPLLDITYKPWRLYFIVCSFPEIIIATILIFLPESPKFILGQGKKSEAYEILQKVNRWNNGKNSSLEIVEIYEEIESIDNRKRILDCKKSQFPLLKSVWIQTAPLLRPPYLRSTLLICSIQFGTYATCNGLFMFFGQVVNAMSVNLDSFVHDRMMMCDAIKTQPANFTTFKSNGTDQRVCVEKLELETLEQGVIVEIMFAIGQILIALMITKVGKYPIILFVLTVCGGSGFLCMLTDIPIIQIYAFSLLVSSGLALNVVNSVAVESFPTAFRAMAMSISLMFGRLGGVLGANVAALLLDNHCQTVFYLSGSSLLAIGVLAFFIPNIHQKISDVNQSRSNARLSVIAPRASVHSLR